MRRPAARPRTILAQPIAALMLACCTIWTPRSGAATAVWNFDGAGNWTTGGNWLDGVAPNAVGDIADFRFNISAARTITLDAPITLGGLRIGDSLGAQVFTFAGPNTLTLDAASGNAFISKTNSTTDVWQAPLALNDHLDAAIHAGVLDITGPANAQVVLTSSGSGIIKSGAGTLRLNIDASAYQGAWIVNNGTLSIGGANTNTPDTLGSGTGGIVLNGTGSVGLAVFSLNNNGAGSGGNITYSGNNDVVLQGAATINVDRNTIGGANASNTIVLDRLTMNGGILGVTGANSYALRFDGTTTLVGDTNVFSPTTAVLTLGGAITDGANFRALIKEGTGRLIIDSTANTYDGATVVKDGFLQVTSGANLGAGGVFVNGGVLSLTDAAQTYDGITMQGGLNLVAQLGTTRTVLPVVGNTGFDIDAGNPLSVSVPSFGMVLGLDGNLSSSIDLSQVGGSGNTRVSIANVGGVDRTFTGTILPASDNTVRLNSAGNTLIFSAIDSLGGPVSTAKVIAGLDYATALVFAGVNIAQGNTGTISVRADNSASLGAITVNRGVTLNINGAITTPLGSGVVTVLGTTLSTDNASAAQFGNTDFRLFGGSTLLLDNAAVATSNSDRRLQPATNIDLTSSTLRLIGDGGAVTAASQTVASIDYAGGSTISVDTDGTTAGRLTTLTTGSLNRGATRGTLNLRSISANATTFGTSAGTQKLIIGGAPAGMMNAGIAPWGGTNSNDASLPQFATYDATHGVQAAAFGVTATSIALLNTSTAATVLDISGLTGTNTMSANVSALAARLRTTANSQVLANGGFTLNIGASAPAGQGAGLFVTHTANDTVAHTANVSFGAQEGMLYVATTGGTSGVVSLDGVLSGTNGITRFGDGILRLGGANTFTGPLTLNSGETRLNNVGAAGAGNDIHLWGGSLHFNAATQRHNNSVTFFNDARLGNVNVANTGFNNLAVAPRTGSTAPIVIDLRAQAGTNQTTAYGGFTLNGPARIYTTHILQVNGALGGTGALEKFGNERLFIGGDSIGYTQPVTINTGFLNSLNSASTAKPFGLGAITVNPGGSIRIAAPANLYASQLTLNSDFGGISALGVSFVVDPATLPVIAVNSTAPWKGTLAISAAGFSRSISQELLWGGGSYLGAPLGDTGIFTGTLSPDGSTYRLGTGQGTLRVASPLTGAANSVQIGVSMTGDVGRADQAVNNSGGTVQFDVPMTYGGGTIINTIATLRISAATATAALGPITLNGGTLQFDSLAGQLRMIAPLTIGNALNLAADGTIQMQNNASSARLTGAVNLAPGSTGVVRTLTVGIDGANAGHLFLDGGISDGAGGMGNHFVKAGQGAAFLAGTNTYTGSTTVIAGLLAVNANADFGNTSQIILSGGGLAAWENSFTLDRNVSINGGLGFIDVQAGLMLTQGAASTIDGGGAGATNGFIAKRGLGTLVLNGDNAQPGIIVLDGVLQVNNQAALGDAARTGAADIQIGGDLALGGTATATRFTGGTLRINDNVVTTRGITFNNNASSIYSGGIDVTGANFFTVTSPIAQGTEFDFWFKTGTGTLVATGANTFRQAAFANGTYQFSNATPWTNSTATAADNTILEWLGGTIRAVNTVSSISLTNLASTTTYNYGGGLHLQMESGVGLNVVIATDNLLRQNQGTLVIETVNGTTLGGAAFANSGQLSPVNAVNTGVARASALTNGIFAPHIVAADDTGVASFTTNDATTGIKPYTGATLASLSGSNATGIGDITSSQALSSVNSIYAFRTNADVNGGTLLVRAIDNLNMGAVLINGSNTIGSNLVFDPTSASAPGIGTPGEALVYVMTGESAVLTGTLLANGLTTFGRGTLTLSGNTSVLGDISVQDGTLKLGGGLTSRMNGELNINSGATLDLNGNSIVIETLDSNNRQVSGTGGAVNFGGAITSGSAATLSMAGPQNSLFTGTLNGALKLMKAGSGVLTIDGFRASTPDSGSNTFTGGTDIYGVGTTGGITLDNAPFGLGGAGASTPGSVNLFSGTLSVLYTGNATTFAIAAGTNGQQYNNLAVRIGADGTDGLTLNVRGSGLLNLDRSVGAIGQGNIMQFGALNMSDTTLTTTGANLYRARIAGLTTILGAQASFQTNSDGPSGALELAAQIVGAGALNKLGDGSMRGIVITGTNNTYAGGTNIIAGDVQVTAASGTPLGSGPVRVFPDGTLRLAGNGSVDGAQLRVMSRVNALGAVGLDDNFDPTVLTSANFASAYNTTLQLSQPYFTQPLSLASIGDGRAFLGSALAQEVKYMAATLGAGASDPWNPGTGVYRLVGGVNNLAFDGVNNVLTGSAYLQVGPQRNMVLGAATNTGNSVIIRNSNNFTGGTQIAEGTVIIVELGGSPIGETPLGTGAIEIYGELRIQGTLGSLWKADANSPTNPVALRPSGLIRIIDNIGLTAGNQGRWGDAVGLDLNGGQFRYDGAANWNSTETIGAVTVRKGGILNVVRANTASSAQLNLAGLSRTANGTLTLAYTSGFLGTNNTTPLSYERVVVSGGVARAGTTTNGAGVINGGIAPVWIVDQVLNTYLGYDPTGSGTGFQPVVGAAPGTGEVAYNKIISGALTVGGLVAGDIADLTTAAKTLADNPTLYALRFNQNISPTATNNTLTITSGGFINTGTPSINPTGAITAGVVSPMTINFGGEAIIYNAGNMVMQAQMNAPGGLTKFGLSQFEVRSINPGLGGVVTVNQGTLLARVPFSGSGSAVGTVLNGRDIVLNAGLLQLDGFIANDTGTASEIASTVRATAVLGSNVFVRGDATLGNNGQANYVRIGNLTFENAGGAVAMNGNGVIALALQSGIWVDGTTTLIPQARINSTFNGLSQSTLAGQVTGAGGVLEKFGNGALTLLNAANNYSGGTIINGTVNATATSVVASALRGEGTPFGSGSITVNPGGNLRLADNANIAGNAVTLKSDGIGLAGIGLAHNGPLPAIITSGSPGAGQVRIDSNGPFGGALTLDYGFYSRPLDLAAIGNGDWWLGNSTQAEAFYFNPALGPNANGRYQLGAGGNQNAVEFGGVLVSTARTALFENVFTGGSANATRVEVGALTADLFANGPSFVNGNSAGVGMTFLTRNTGLVGDVRVNTNSTLNLGNNFALGSGRLVLNGGNLRYDTVQSITIDNAVLLTGDFSTSNGNDFVIKGTVTMHEGSAGATRIWSLAGTGTMGVYGVISGADGSNLIKSGAQNVVFAGDNTFQGYTQINQGLIIASGNVAPSVSGPLGVSDSPVVLASGAANLAGGIGIGGKFSFGRDIILGQATGTGSAVIDARTNERAVVTGGISLITGGILTVGAAAADVVGFRGGSLDVQGVISGAGSLLVGTTAVAPANGGTVLLSAGANGYGTNTFSGGVTLNSARLLTGTDTYFAGPANNPTILGGPLGVGTFTFGAGETNRGGAIAAIDGARTIVNALGALSTAANTTLTFAGREALAFTRDLNINSNGTLRTRTFAVQNPRQPIEFSGNFTNTGVQGGNIVKNGVGTLVLTGANANANLLTTDGNYGAAFFVDAGILRVNADAALGSTASLAAAGPHLLGPADVRLRGGTLSIATGFTTARQIILTANSGIDVASGQTLTLSTRTAGAFAITKTGDGALALENPANTQTAITMGGPAQQIAGAGRFSHTGGTVSTTATTGTPFVAGATGTVTIHSGTLSLIGGGTAQALNVPRLVYGAAARVGLSAGATSSTLTASEAAATAFQRAGTFNGVSFGTMVVQPNTPVNLGNTERLLITNAAAQPAGAGGSIITVPSIVTAAPGIGQDANFVRYDSTNGFTLHNVATVGTLAASAPANVGDIVSVDIAGAGIIDILNLRTAASITPTDGSTLIRVLNGGLIVNGSTAPNIGANVLFGTSGSSLTEALVYVRDGQSGASVLSGDLSARDFTKFGPGSLMISGATNVLAATTARLPVLSVQEGTLSFASPGALFQNGHRGNEAGLFTLSVNESGVFDLNGLSLSIAGLAGNGTITSSVAGAVTLTSTNGFGVDTIFNGAITDGAGTIALTKTANGTLTLGGFSTFAGGVSVQAGRVTNSQGAPVALGGIDVRSIFALGGGTVSLAGGTLAINNNVAHAEVEDGIDFNTFGPGNGYDFVIAASGFTNGTPLPANTSSTININSSNTATLVSNTGIHSLTIDAPILTIGGGANLGLLFVKGATTFSLPDTVVRTASGRLFLGGRVNASGKAITKIGANDLVLTHTEGGAEQSAVALWKVYGGLLNPRVADGAANPLGSNTLVEINGGSTAYGLFLHVDGNGTTLSERVTVFQNTTIRYGSMLPISSDVFVSSGASRVQVDRILANNSNKTVVLNSLEVGGALGTPYVFTTGGNGDSLWFNGTTTFTRDLYLQNDVPTTLNGVISGSGTFAKRAGTNLFINADNTSGWEGGTILGVGGTTFLGSFEGNQLTLSDTAKLGTGPVIVNSAAALQINSAGNLQAGQRIHVGGNLNDFGMLRLAADLSLDQLGFRAAGLGGAPAAASNYYLTSTNPATGALALNTIYTKALDLRTIGDGTWFLGSSTNGVGANGSYDAATLGAGFNNTYRLGAGGSTIFVGSNGVANVLTDTSRANSVVIGAPLSIQNNGVMAFGSGNVVLLASQNYTGTTLINRASTLDVRGALATSAIEIYGGLNIAGEGGTLLAGGSNIPVALRPGATLRFDNTAAGVLPVSAAAGRWQDSTDLTLDSATLRMQGNAAVETSETIGALTVQGGSFLEIVRGVIGRGTELRTSSINRAGAGTLTFNTTSEQLGSDERLVITGASPTVTNGMVAPWMVTNTNIDFLTYNADTGFVRAGFTRNLGGTQAAAVSLPTERVLSNADIVLNTGITATVHALRLDNNLTLGTAADATAQMIIGSGGLISNGTRTINAGLVFGSVATPVEALVFNNGTTTIGDTANFATSGQIIATSLTKSGAGTLVMQSNQSAFAGNINVNQGILQLSYAPSAAITAPTVNIGTNGGTIFLNGANTQLNLLGGNDNLTGSAVFNANVTIGDFNPIVQFFADRAGGAITDRRAIIGGNFSFGQNNLETGQIARFTTTNSFDFQLGDSASDLVTLNGKSVFVVDNALSGQGRQLFVGATVTGPGTLVKGPIDTRSDLMLLENVTTLNDWSGGTIVAGGTLRIYAKATNVAAGASTNLTAGSLGTGVVTLMAGSLDLRVDNDGGGAPDTNAERTFFSATGNGFDLVVGGSATINVDRTGLVAAGTTKQIALNNLTIGSQLLTVTGGNAYSLEVAGATTLLGNLFLNNSVDTVLSGAVSDGGAGLFINKINTGVLWIGANTSTLAGGAYINAGMLRFGSPRGGSTTAQLGSGQLTINPDAEIRLEASANINTGAGQRVHLVSTPYAVAVFRTPALTQAEYQALLTPTSSGLLSLLGTESNALDMSSIGGGRMVLTSVEADRTYNAATLEPGLPEPGGTNRVHRLGGRNSNTLILNLSGTGNLTDVAGPTDVRIGSLANLGPQASWGIGFVLLQDQNTYTGTTTVVRGSSMRFDQNSTSTAGPLGAPGASAIHTYGILRAEGANGSFVDAGNTASAYTNLVLHPGSELRFQDTNASGAASDRWHDGTPIELNGSLLTLQTPNTAGVVGSESVGPVSFERGSRIQAVTQNTAEITLTTPGVTRTDKGTLTFVPSAVNRLGIAPAANSERVVVSGAAPTNVSGTNMLPGYYGVQVENRFATYGADGFAPVADGAMTSYAAALPATAIVNVQATTTLVDEPAVFAIRIGAFTLNSITGASNDSTITFTGSGSDIGGIITSGAATIHPNLKFGASGGNEALINTVGGNLTITGNISANGVTKFGANTLVITNDQSDAARGLLQGYGGGWVVNEGTLQLATFGSAGNAVVANTITLNGSQLGAAQLNLRAQPADTLLNYSYTSGRIVIVDNAVIDWDPGASDRVHTIAGIEIQQAGGNGPVDAQLRFANNRDRSILAAGPLTLTHNAIVNVDATADRSVFFAYTLNNANLTTGTSSGVSLASLNGSGNFTKWGDGYLYIRGASPSFTGSVTIDQGAVHVTHNASLGTGAVSVNRYGVLDIGVANFTPTNSSLTYNEASVERWSVNGARSGAVNLGPGTLQVAADQNGTANVIIAGGSIEGWLRADDITETNRGIGVFRNLGTGIGVTLAGDSFVGSRYYEGANGIDMGKQSNDLRPLDESFGSGVILDIKGTIAESGGARSLTKVGYDTVILSGASSYTGGTIVTGGKLLLGRNDALAPTGPLRTHADGVLDLNGYNQTVGRLSNSANPATPGATSGYITNSAATTNTLTVGNGVSTDFTYSGIVQHNVALTKTGPAVLTLANGNTFRGTTAIDQGTIKLELTGSIEDSRWISVGPGATFDVSAKLGGYSFDGAVSGGGVDPAGTTFATVVNAARIAGAFAVTDHIGEVSLVGHLSPGASTDPDAPSTAGNLIGHIYANDDLTLDGGITGTSPAEPTTRLTLQLNGATTTLAALGFTSGRMEDFVDSLSGTEPGLNGAAGNLAGHDYLRIGGTFTINANGRIVVQYLAGFQPSLGEVFNVGDWSTLNSNAFTFGARFQDGSELGTDLDLPILANAIWRWDTSLFASAGALVVVPEPGCGMLSLAGLLLLGRRRHR
ncbi:MAG: autotransporter-associated beta strand repeat-containing protein [Chthoniobacteraceae bacterium]